MSIHHTLHNNILDNPIQRRENLSLSRQQGKWLWRVLYVITAFIMLIPVFWGFGRYFSDSLSFTLGLLTLANIIVFITVVVRAVTYASDSIYRERQGKTWELLMLTGVSNWRVVLGKWLGIMLHLTRDYLWLFIIRFGTLFWLTVNVNLYQDFSYQALSSYYNPTVSLFDIRIGGAYFFVAVILLLMFTVLELMMSTAIGLSVAFFKFKAKTSSGIGVMIRIGLAVLIPLVTYFAFAKGDGDSYAWNIDRYHYGEELLFFTFRTTTYLIDNGMISTMIYADPRNTLDEAFGLLTLTNFVGIAVYLLFTGIALGVAANRAFVRGLDVGDRNPVKIKRKRPIAALPIRSETSVTEKPATITIPSNSDHVFNFENAEQLSVDIHHYQRRLGRMTLRITGNQAPIYVQLSNVAYMEAPAFWKGANFRTANDAEYQAFVQEKGIYSNGLTEDSMHLYLLDSKTPVRIVAGIARVLEELPDNL